MKHLSDIKTKSDVIDLTNEEMYYIDRELQFGGVFSNDECDSEFARQWVLRGIGC